MFLNGLLSQCEAEGAFLEAPKIVHPKKQSHVPNAAGFHKGETLRAAATTWFNRMMEALWSTQQKSEQVVKWTTQIWWAVWQIHKLEQRTSFHSSSLEKKRKPFVTQNRVCKAFSVLIFQMTWGVWVGTCQLLMLIDKFTTPSDIDPLTPNSSYLQWLLVWKWKQIITKDSLKSSLYPWGTRPDDLTSEAYWEFWTGKENELKPRTTENLSDGKVSHSHHQVP